MQVPLGAKSHPSNHLHLLLSLPRKSEHQRVELRLRQRHRRCTRGCLARPHKADLVQASRRAPHAEPVVYQQLDARGPCIGEQVAVMGMSGTEYLHHSREQSIGASAHVDWLDREPQPVDASHRNHSRSHAAQAPPPCTGQLTVMVDAPRRSSTRMSAKPPPLWAAATAAP